MLTQKERKSVDHLYLLLQWTLFSYIGFALGLASAFGISKIWVAQTGKYPSEFLLYALQGVWIGIGQWLVLREEVSNSAWWIPATSIGVLLSHIIEDHSIMMPIVRQYWIWDASNLATSTMISAIAGSLLGIIQWVVLRQWAKYSVVWIPVQGGAKAIATLLYELFFTGAMGTMTGGILAYYGIRGSNAIISALGLIWLLRHPRANVKKE
ncbi:hypothetical protein ACFLZW_07675 [Chloroflexota bacterium]